jgi:hypothetical protein
MDAIFIIVSAFVCVAVQTGAIVWFGIVTIMDGKRKKRSTYLRVGERAA